MLACTALAAACISLEGSLPAQAPLLKVAAMLLGAVGTGLGLTSESAVAK